MIDADRLSKGLYWQQAWKLVEGCTKISPGCDNCWSEAETLMRAKHPNDDIRLRARDVSIHCGVDGSVSDGTARGYEVAAGFDGRILLREDNLELPLRKKKPTVFSVWNDLFHESVSDEFRDRAYAVMALCPQHTFLVLTKRAQRMAEYFEDGSVHQWDKSIDSLSNGDRITVENTHLRCVRGCDDEWHTVAKEWPLPNVWHGVTAENQQTADERVPHLLRVPGKRFLSIEPMLGPVDLGRVVYDGVCAIDCLRGLHGWPIPHADCEAVHAVLLGGESGKNARPMHPDWARNVREQCAEAGVPFYFKQWGEFVHNEWPERGWLPDRVGKRAAGRRLDGRTHDDLPWGSP